MNERTPSATAAASEMPAPIYIDLGRQRKKHIKRLRRGEGKLAVAVQETIAQLQAAGHGTAPVVIICEVKPKENAAFGPFVIR